MLLTPELWRHICWVQSQPGLHSELQGSQNYIVRPYLQKQTNKSNWHMYKKLFSYLPSRKTPLGSVFKVFQPNKGEAIKFACCYFVAKLCISIASNIRWASRREYYRGQIWDWLGPNTLNNFHLFIFGDSVSLCSTDGPETCYEVRWTWASQQAAPLSGFYLSS